MKYFGLLIFLMQTTIQLASVNPLDQLALKYGTDKSSSIHNYTKIYNDYFKDIKHEPLKFLEIGIAGSASALMWENYFDKASLFFVDIDTKSISHAKTVLSNRSQCFQVDQGNHSQLLQFIKETGGNFDIIIDDGGHTMQQQIESFKTLFPALAPNGLYIIEDLHTSFWKMYGGGGTNEQPDINAQSTLQFLKGLVADVNTIGGYTGFADVNKCPNEINDKLTYFQKHIQSIHFYNSICFIFKR